MYMEIEDVYLDGYTYMDGFGSINDEISFFFFFLIRRKVRNASFYSCVFPREQKKVEGRMLYIWMYVRFGDESLMSLDGMEIDVIECIKVISEDQIEKISRISKIKCTCNS